jgi:hypothetical protein
MFWRPPFLRRAGAGRSAHTGKCTRLEASFLFLGESKSILATRRPYVPPRGAGKPETSIKKKV